MSKKLILFVVAIGIGISSFSQTTINDYKYVVVPLKADFFKGKDAYRTSTLLRYLFKKEGFEVYFDEEELPEELFNDRCLGLYANLAKISSFLKTKVQIELKDCRGREVFVSDIGSTKIKEYIKAYPEAIREAFKSIEFLNYEYNPSANVGSKPKQNISKAENELQKIEETKAAEAEVVRLKKEVEDLNKQKELAKAKADLEKEKQLQAEKLEQRAEKKSLNSEVSSSDTLYAQAIDVGFQVVDATPKVVMVLLKTAAPNVYAVKGKDAIVFKENDKWIYSEGNQKKELKIKF
ncbi:hypothetical protein DFQ05_0069 [Winogradskyella wandonensis]|uniref:Uncharacterized protein n=1 Tax=Winogradskyella wandonensis TaxID=1442586 RepID=A0A4V2PU27_9FLAO|nr:hypothetical protein [Winogradskyella wandonensis]TCK68561.1 hypothetical protein DFQ05_0069 [Winogradskyella wandonensis]